MEMRGKVARKPNSGNWVRLDVGRGHAIFALFFGRIHQIVGDLYDLVDGFAGNFEGGGANADGDV